MSPDENIPPDEVCPPCRGTGTVISNLGGEPHPVECPWCHGTGRLPRPQ
jgi:DnaJ-class molecular chaperone